MKPTSPLWYLAALGLALGGWVIATVVAAGAWDTVREASISNSSEPLEASGQSVAVFTDVLQPERRVTCEAKIEGVKKPKPIRPAGIDLVINDDGTDWYLIGFEHEGSDGMRISCTPKDKGADNATYGFAVVEGWNDRANAGNAIAIAGTVLGIGLAIWTFVSRLRQSHEEAGDAST